MHPDTTSNESDLHFPTKKLRSRSSLSTSLSSLEDLSQVDLGLSKSRSELHAQPASKHNESNVSIGNSSSSKELDSGSPGPSSMSQVSQITHESLLYDLPPTQSPPIQEMERSKEYDPLRIPSTVFERSKSSTTLEWSAASNESLFSLHLGNNSFSREDVFMFGGEVLKSGEIPMSGEFVKFSPTDSVPVVGTDGNIFELEKNEATGESDDSINVATSETAEDQSKEKRPTAKVTRISTDISNHSNESAHSFAFPIKTCRRKKCAWPSCYCSNCSCTLCYCSWPSCYLMWPSHCLRWPSCYCSNCSWAFCYCWNCSLKRWCCHSSSFTTLTEGTANDSGKTEDQKQQQQLPDIQAPSKSAACNCFSCFSCHPLCCCCHCSRCC